jgi:glutamate formiminotransferase
VLPLEFIPNVSEGRRREVIDRCAAAAAAPGVRLLDVSSDPDHNRSVLTLAGDADGLVAALGALYETALEAIDLGEHSGVHPRIGAVDVVPFVPLGDTPMAAAVAAARRLAEAVAGRFELPVYLYAVGAALAWRRRLPDLRRGQLPGLAERLADPAWAPDFGPPRLHPTAGATVIGARTPLIAFNALLDTADLGVARRVARAVRESGGGLPGVRAIGVPLASRGRAQVSMNLVDPARTSMARALAAVKDEAARHGAAVVECELIGLVPEAAAWAALADGLVLPGFGAARVIARRRAEEDPPPPAAPPPADR